MKNFDRDSFTGTHTALITPFNLQGQIDRKRFEEQIERQIAGGVQGIVPVGTTGESPTLSHGEHIAIIKAAVEIIAKGRTNVLAGTGSNSTDEAVVLTRGAEAAGANATLQVAPYYNKPSQEGLFGHFRTIARKTALPVILYNIPSRCGVAIEVETVERLRDACPNIVGIKEAGGSSDRVTELRLRLGEEFIILSGDDSLTVPFISVGADGVISVLSNIIPKEVADLVGFALRGDAPSAMQLHQIYYSLTKSLFIEGNPVGVKCAMELMGLDSGFVRSPLSRASEKTRKLIRRYLKEAEVVLKKK